MKIKKILFLTILVVLLTGCSKNAPEKFSYKWFQENKDIVLPQDGVCYYLIDNPIFLENTDIENTFAMAFSLYQADYSMMYDVVGTKFTLYSIDNKFRAYFCSEEDIESFTCNENTSFPENSLVQKDIEMIKKMISPDYSSCLIKFQKELDTENVISLSTDEYIMYLYLDKESNQCTRFEYSELVQEDGILELGEYFICYVSPCKGISIPSDFSYENVVTIEDLSNEFDNFLMGSMYMLELTEKYSLYYTESE